MTNTFARADNLFTNNFLIEDEVLPDINQVSSVENSPIADKKNDENLLSTLLHCDERARAPPSWQDLLDKERDFLQKKHNSFLNLQPLPQAEQFTKYFDEIKSLNNAFEKEIEDIKIMSKLYRNKIGEWAIMRCALDGANVFKHNFSNVEDAFFDDDVTCGEIADNTKVLGVFDCGTTDLEMREIILKKEINVLFEGMRAKARAHKITAAKLGAANIRVTMAQGTIFKDFVDTTCETVNKVFNDRMARFDYEQLNDDIMRACLYEDAGLGKVADRHTQWTKDNKSNGSNCIRFNL